MIFLTCRLCLGGLGPPLPGEGAGLLTAACALAGGVFSAAATGRSGVIFGAGGGPPVVGIGANPGGVGSSSKSTAFPSL